MTHARCPVLAVPPPDLIRTLRPWPHDWRPEDFTGQEEGQRHAAAILAQPVSVATRDLPAYRGAPYYQPCPPSRKRQLIRQLRLATMIGAGIFLVILIGLLLSSSMP